MRSPVRPHVRADHPAPCQTIREQSERTGVSFGDQSPLRGSRCGSSVPRCYFSFNITYWLRDLNLIGGARWRGVERPGHLCRADTAIEQERAFEKEVKYERTFSLFPNMKLGGNSEQPD